MVDFDELKARAESLLGEHPDQVESGIDKLADLAGKQFGHAAQIDEAADKLKAFVDEQRSVPGPDKPRQGRPGQPKPGNRPHPGQGGGPRPGGKGKGPKSGPKQGPRPAG